MRKIAPEIMVAAGLIRDRELARLAELVAAGAEAQLRKQMQSDSVEREREWLRSSPERSLEGAQHFEAWRLHARREEARLAAEFASREADIAAQRRRAEAAFGRVEALRLMARSEGRCRSGQAD